MKKSFIPVYHNDAYKQTTGQYDQKDPDAKASSNNNFNPEVRYEKLLASTKNAKAARPAMKDKWRSKFQSGHPALFTPTPTIQKFHQRTRDLNNIPIFYAGFATEIAQPEDINKLPSNLRAKELERLYAKRMVGADGKNLHSDDPNDTSNPPLHAQNQKTRELRIEAATSTISNFSGEYISRLYSHATQNIDPTQPATFYVVRPTRHPLANDSTVNFLSAATQTEVTDSLNALAKRHGHAIEFSDQKNMYVLSRTARSTASPIGRIVQQGYLDTSELKEGDKLIIADDHTQAGGTLLAMAAAARQAGATVVAAATPTTHPFCRTLALSENVKATLEKTLNNWDTEGKVRRQLAQFGMPIETLTNFDAMIVIAYATDPENQEAVELYKNLEDALFDGNRVLEGKGDSLIPILNQKPLTPDEVVTEMINECQRSRIVTSPRSPKNIHIFDWDDTLRDEKGMNYQLMHNSLAIAAHRHGKNHPFLVDLNQAMEASRGKYQEGMPLLCMTQQDYSKHTIQHAMLKKDMITDLLGKLNALSPALETQYLEMKPTIDRNDRRQSEPLVGQHISRARNKITRVKESSQEDIINILYTEFSRQYQLMIRPEVDEKLTAKSDVKVPFPNVAPELMAGAQALLDKVRNPDNAVFLISNKGDRYIRDELAKLGLEHYFDAVSGTPAVSVTGADGITKVKRIDSKPSTAQLQRIISKRHDLHSVETVTSWGDTTKDITQILRAIKDGLLAASKNYGVIVNPSSEIKDSTINEAKDFDIPGTKKPTIVAADTLTDKKIAGHLRDLDRSKRSDFDQPSTD